MSLITTSAWNGLAVAIRMGTALLLNKILAVYVGPGGYAVIGQFQNLVSVLTTFASGGANTGVTKYTAEYFDDAAAQRRVWRTAGVMMAMASLVCTALLIAFRRPLAGWLLKDEALASVMLWLAGGLVFVSLNGLLLAILNGRKEVRRYVFSNIAGSLIALIVTGTLAYQLGLYGALVALSINQAIVFVVTLQQTLGVPWFRLRDMIGTIDLGDLRRLLGYVAMAATSAIVLPASQIAVRNHLIADFGWTLAGCWDAITRISGLYLTFVTTTLTLYYLPRLAEIQEGVEVRREIWKTFKVVVPAVATVALILYLARHLVSTVLFAPAFTPMEQLFAWQMTGDVIKIASWILSFVMLGRGMVRTFIVTEILFAASFWGLALVCTRLMGFVGVSAAYTLNYFLYLLTMYVIIIVRPARSADTAVATA